MRNLWQIIDSVLVLKTWLLTHTDWVSVVIQIITASVVFILSNRLSRRAKLEHKESIKKKIVELSLGREVYLVNVKRYDKDYPANDEKFFSGYSHIKAEYKTARFNGIEFICGIKDLYRKEDGTLTTDEKHKDNSIETIRVYEIGLIPYEWIEYIDLRGDEHGYKPLIFCYYKGRRYWQKSLKRLLPCGYPYSEIYFYRKSDVFSPSAPADMEFVYVNELVEVSNSLWEYFLRMSFR